MYIYMINKARQRYTPRTAFSFFKEKTALGGIRTHDTPRSRRALYQLSYQGNSHVPITLPLNVYITSVRESSVLTQTELQLWLFTGEGGGVKEEGGGEGE